MITSVFLPSNFKIEAIDRFTREVVSADGTPQSLDFSFDFSRLNFIDGSGYTVLSNTLEWLLSQGAHVSIKGFDKNTQRPAISYLDDCGFFRSYLKSPLDKNASRRPTTLPCSSVQDNVAFSWIEHKISPWLSNVLFTSHASLGSLRTCVKEVFHNISDHSTLNTGFVHVQHYPNIRNLKITVSDFGLGIPSTIRQHFGEMDDGAAILLASKEGVTAKSRPNNMGAGLNYLIDTIVGNRGSVLIHSLSGSLYCARGKGDLPFRKASLGRGVYPGTLIDITLDARLFVGDEEDRMDIEW